MTVHRMTAWGVALLLATAPLVLAGCRSLRSVPPETTAAQPAWNVRPGDDLRLTLTNGRSVTCTVAAVESDVIVAKDGARYPFTDIREVERREISSGKTAAAVGGSVLGVLLAGAILVIVGTLSILSGI